MVPLVAKLHSEVERILSLPIQGSISKEQSDEISFRCVSGDKFQEGFRLFRPQTEALITFSHLGCGFFPIGVGEGKTLITVWAANFAYTQWEGFKKILLLVPSNLILQLTKMQIPWIREHLSISVPVYNLGKMTREKRKILVDLNRSGLYIMPYSLLSTTDTDYLLTKINPKLIICDEGQNLANRDSARSKRLFRYIAHKYTEEGETIHGVVLSGTLTKKSVKDYWHLIDWCLGQYSPLPRQRSLACDWGRVIDATGDAMPDTVGCVVPLLEWALLNFPESQFPANQTGFRRAYMSRLQTIPGVVTTGENSLGTRLDIDPSLKSPILPEHQDTYLSLCQLQKQVVDDWISPSGDVIEFAIHKFRYLYELSSGIYYEQLWPEIETIQKHHSCEVKVAEDYLERAKYRHSLLQEYHRELRAFLLNTSIRGLDTPLLVAKNLSDHGDKNVPKQLYRFWADARDLEFQGIPERYSSPKRICPYKVDHTIEIAKTWDEDGGVIWTYHRDVGEWIFEKASKIFPRVFLCQEGQKSDSIILDPANADAIVIASSKAHGVGKNLQHFKNQVFVQWPRSAAEAEQILGRLHRSGQQADEIVAPILNSNDFDFGVFAACLNESVYIQQSTGKKQRLLYANYLTFPRFFPIGFLIERGIKSDDAVNPDVQKYLKDRFRSINHGMES